jgi:hypothetical protein
MSWVPSIFKSKPKTSYKYETQADLDKLTANEIINIDPKEVSVNVEKNKGGVNLPGDKRAAMFRLLSIKREEERNPSLSSRRASVVDKLTNQDKEVEQLMRDTQAEIDAEAFPQVPATRPYSEKKGGRTRRRRASRAKRAIKRSYKRSNKRTQRTRRR